MLDARTRCSMVDGRCILVGYGLYREVCTRCAPSTPSANRFTITCFSHQHHTFDNHLRYTETVIDCVLLWMQRQRSLDSY